MSESVVLARVRLWLGAHAPHIRLFRNNSGVAFHADGSRVVYGVASPGGADLIGWTTVTVTPAHVGRPLAVFTAAEVKTPAGRLSPAQRTFLAAVEAAGGIAAVVRSEEDAADLARRGP